MRALTLLALAAVGCNDSGGGAAARTHDEGAACVPRSGRVSRVLDGDTLALLADCAADADCAGGECDQGRCTTETKIRLGAISAGEVDGDEAVHCLANEARDALERLALDKEVELTYDEVMGCEDIYKRRLAYLWVGDTLAQQALVQAGLACVWWFTSSSRQEETLYYQRLVSAEDSARGGDRGIWSPNGTACGGLPIHPECR